MDLLLQGRVPMLASGYEREAKAIRLDGATAGGDDGSSHANAALRSHGHAASVTRTDAAGHRTLGTAHGHTTIATSDRYTIGPVAELDGRGGVVA